MLDRFFQCRIAGCHHGLHELAAKQLQKSGRFKQAAASWKEAGQPEIAGRIYAQIEDYWAAPGEFLVQNGDCEDYAIIKILSLKYLGIDEDRMRVVVVQDTNQRIAHAVVSLNRGNDILILDNQIKEVISHKYIYHYVPVYSINEKSWWMHLPK